MDEAQHGGGGAGRTTERDDALPRRSSDRRLVWLGLAATILLVFAYSLLWDVLDERSDTAGYYQVAAQDLDDFRLELIARAPLQYLLHVGHSMFSFWLPNVSTVTFGRSHLAHGFWSLVQFSVVFVFFFQAAVLFGAGVFAWSRLSSSSRIGEPQVAPCKMTIACWLAYRLPLLVIVYTFAVSCLVHHSGARFRTAVLQTAVVGLAIWNHLRKRSDED